MAKTQKYYVVWRGRETGVFTDWRVVKPLVDGYAGPQFKSFKTLEEAESAFAEGYKPTFVREETTAPPATERPMYRAIAVDAACSGNPGKMEYRGVSLWDGKEIFHQKFDVGTNNIGEFLAIVHGLALLKQHNASDVTIYSDSMIAIKWVKMGQCRTKLEQTPRTLEVLDMVRRGERWLEANAGFETPIVKWATEVWGEIPADFGRK